MSHPAWVRGLKLGQFEQIVALLSSHPAWVRGLKQEKEKKAGNMKRSHPAWVRGLKHKVQKCRYISYIVAPRVGAWIETQRKVADLKKAGRRTPRGCVD